MREVPFLNREKLKIRMIKCSLSIARSAYLIRKVLDIKLRWKIKQILEQEIDLKRKKLKAVNGTLIAFISVKPNITTEASINSVCNG